MSAAAQPCVSSPMLRDELNRLLGGEVLADVQLCRFCRLEIEAVSGPADGECRGLLADLRGTLERLHHTCLKERSREECSKLRRQRRELMERLRATCRGDLERLTSVWGVYDCNGRIVRLYLGCYRLFDPCPSLEDAADKYLETLAHEVIHHLQYTGASLQVDNTRFEAAVRYQGCSDTHAVWSAGIPYAYRPHEAEAFDRQAELARILKQSPVAKVLRSELEKFRSILL